MGNSLVRFRFSVALYIFSWVAAGDINHDGWPDLIAAAGPGAGPHVKIYDGKSSELIDGPLGSFFAYDVGFSGGVSVASGDVDGDGWADVITAAGPGGGPHIKVFSGFSGEVIDSFWAFAPEFGGGATVMAADFTGDGKADLAVGAGPGGGPHVKVFDLSTGETIAGPLGSFYAFDSGFSGGVNVGTDYLTGDVSGDGRPDLVVGAGPGGGPNVRVFDGVSGVMIRDFQAFDASMSAGVRVTTAFVNDDQYADIVVGTGAGPTSQVKVFDGVTSAELATPMSPYTPFGPNSTGGVSVAASNDPEGTLASMIPAPVSTIVQNGTYTFTVRLQEATTSNGYQMPTGTIELYYVTTSAVKKALGTATLIPVATGAYQPCASQATVTVPENSFEVGVYRYGFWPQKIGTIYWEYHPDTNWFLGTGQTYAPPLTVKAPLAISGDLDIVDSNGAVVPEDKEEAPGGWVPVNNDNDNYNFYGDQATSLDHKLDKDDAGRVVGEDDLVQITVHGLNSNGRTGHFNLVPLSGNIRIWMTADRNGEWMSFEDLPVGQDLNFWVEGLSLSASFAAEQIKLRFTDSQVGEVLVDQVNFTVYEVTGAMDVPGYSKYKYQAKDPDSSGFRPVFTGAAGGTLTADPPDPAPAIATAKVLWGAGAVVGTYRVSPDQSLLNFFVDREVNVVKVGITAGRGAENRIDYGNKLDQQNFFRIVSAVPAPAMAAVLTVKTIVGPVVNGTMRGVKFVEVGMIQDLTVTNWHANYPFDPVKRRVHKMESHSYLDSLTTSIIPWADSGGETTQVDPALPSPYRGFYPNDLAPTNDTAVANADIRINDTPELDGTDARSLNISGDPVSIAPLPLGSKSVNRFEMMIDFLLYFAVRTKEESLGSKSVFTQRGIAKWFFNGSGDVDQAGKWVNDLAAAGNREKDDHFSEVIDGSVVPITIPPLANTIILSPGQWSTM